MSHNSLPADFQQQCIAVLEAAWPGVKVIRFEVDDYAWQRWIPTEERDDPRFDLKVAGTEPALISAGLLEPAAAASIPPCGVCHRGGWRITRRKTHTRLESWGDDPALDRVASVLVGAMVWRPPQTA
jgi:hypothetical protein